MDNDLKDVLKDASDGRLKKESKEKVQKILKAQENASKVPSAGYKWVYKGKEFDKLTDIDVDNHNQLINRGVINRKG